MPRPQNTPRAFTAPDAMDFSGTHDLGENLSDTQRIIDKQGAVFLVRRMRREDEAAVCKVCLRTGDAGKDATSQFADGMLLGRRWVLPYFEHNPSLTLVLEKMETGLVLENLLQTTTPNFHISPIRRFKA